MAKTSATVLDARLKLVSIPRSRLQECMHCIVRCMVFRTKLSSHRHSDPFFHVSVNKIELSIFADEELIDEVFDDYDPDASGIEISEDTWVPLQIEQHEGNSWELSGSRIRELSAPLAAEGISLLFLSTYISDFLLIKSHRLTRVAEILEREDVNVQQPPQSYRGPSSLSSSSRSKSKAKAATTRMISPVKPMNEPVTLLSDLQISPFPKSLQAESRPDQFLPPHTSSLSNSRPSSSLGQFGDSLRNGVGESPPVQLPLVESTASQAEQGDPSQPRSYEQMQQSILSDGTSSSYIFDKISLLPDELVCVGLSMQHEPTWRYKLIQAIFFMDDIMPGQDRQRRLRFTKRRNSSTTSSISASSSTDDDAVDAAASRPFVKSPTSALRGSDDLSTTPRPRQSQNGRLDLNRSSSASSCLSDASPTISCATSAALRPTPFFSLTLTTEGGSLMADVRLLRTMFKGEEENVIYASGQGGLSGEWQGEMDEGALDAIDQASPRPRTASHDGSYLGDDSHEWQHVEAETNPEEQEYNERQLFKCLQLDLSSFGLEKAGLAHQFAGILTQQDINLLYSSTYRTANILVAKRHIRKARRALETASK